MERNSAACAMDWSIELEKALRSKKPGRSVEAITQMEERFCQWSREPEPTMAVYNMFGLVPGEDRLFANAILLRLADAFRLGDRDTRISVVKVFLSELRNRDKKRKGKLYKGILSKATVHNHTELLERVKIVFDTGDVESRALALVLFGCWADFAKDSPHIRYLVLSSMISSDVLEVKASLFAASCLCALADDFASVVLEMLLNMVASSETSLTIKLAAARVFAKMGCSHSTANRAYKTGLQLVLDSSEEDFLVAMLISLSKLASKSTLLLSEQVELLLSFLSRDRSWRLQATALRCLHFIVVEGVCHTPVTSHVIKGVLRIIEEAELPSAMQYEGLQILHKMLLFKLPNLLDDNTLEIAHLLTIVENSTQSPVISKSLLAIRVLVDVSTKLGGRTEMGSVGDFISPLPVRIISKIIDWIILLVKLLLEMCETNNKVFLDVQSLLNLLLLLVRERPDLSVLVLDKIRLVIEYLEDMHEGVIATWPAGSSVHEIVDFREEKSMGISLKLAYIVHKFSVTCIENVNEVGAITTQIFDKVKLLVECVHRCSLFDCYMRFIYSILMHSQIIWCCIVNESEEYCNIGRNLGNSLHNHLAKHEILSLEYAKKMLTERGNWPAYKAGIFAACQGAWLAAAFIFEQLMGEVQSESCFCWLKSLAQFAQSERKIQLFLLPKLGFSSVNWPQLKEFPITPFRGNSDEIGQGAIGNNTEPNYTEELVGACHALCTSGEILESIVTLSKPFCFQRWFLAIRAKVLGTVADVLKVLGTIPLSQDNICNDGLVENRVTVECPNPLQQIAQISFRLLRLVQEFDLIATSFIGMDSRSSKIISALALSCSLLAFATGFSLFISNLPADEIVRSCHVESLKDYSKGMLIQNLVGRLWLVDQETCSNLWLLSDVDRQPTDCFHLEPRNHILNIDGEMRDILNVCKYAISGIVDLRNEAKRAHNEGIQLKVTKDGLQLLLNTFIKWIHIPFRVPKFFFKVRPCIGSELFALSADMSNPNELSVFSGFHLSLNLCLHLRNVPPDLPIRVTKLSCILCSSASFQEPSPSGETRGQIQLDYPTWEAENLVQMNEKLLCYVTGRTNRKNNSKRGRDKDIDNDDGVVSTFVCFELNDRGQGFSDCLLDVSHFPVGSYRIKWHSCCIDRQGSYWSLLPLNAGPIFTVQKPPVVG